MKTIEIVNKVNLIADSIQVLCEERDCILRKLYKEHYKRICTLYGRKCIITNVRYDNQDGNCVVFHIAFGVNEHFWQDTQTATVEKLEFTDEFYTSGNVKY